MVSMEIIGTQIKLSLKLNMLKRLNISVGFDVFVGELKLSRR